MEQGVVIDIATHLTAAPGVAGFLLVSPAGAIGATILVQDCLDTIFNPHLVPELLACVQPAAGYLSVGVLVLVCVLPLADWARAILLLLVLRGDGADDALLGVRTIALDVPRLLAFVALGISLLLTLGTGAAPVLPSGHLHLFFHESP